MSSSPPLIAVSHLTFAYSRDIILQDISFAIGHGETWAIIGKNGAGKSTLIKCLARLLPIAHSSILIDGKEINLYTPKELAKVLAYVPQASCRTLPPYTVFEYCMMGRFPYQGFMAIPNENDRAVVADTLKLTDTYSLEQRPMNTLSGGELQRVFLAGAVAQRTKVMLLDEPATFLDPLHQEMVHCTLKRIHEELGTTIITITHDLNAALSKYSHVLAILDNKLFYAGPTEKFLLDCQSSLQKLFSMPFENVTIPGTNRTIVYPRALV